MSQIKAEAGDAQTSEPSNTSDKLNELDLNDLMVETKNMTFTYDAKKGNLLNHINMTFPRSAIYGFLGPSGCGKTTIIKLIIGRLKPVVGSIKINGKSQGDPSNKIPGVGIGYMPQEYALFNEFTIMETLTYFSKIYGLNSDYKKKRIDFLIKFLELPDPNRMVDVLSGGQKRRTSLAIALIHNPPLLIMDEPTVGVDPMLRERIWQHLVELSVTEKTSIMITTHYIEECRRAHVIALMRGGNLLVENSPTVLLKHFKTNSLEDVFLQVCKFEEQVTNLKLPPNLAKVRQTNLKSKKPGSSAVKKVWSNSSFTSTFCGRYSALVTKNVNRLFRQKLVFFVQILIPILCGVLICVTFGKKPFDLKVAVFNGETNGVESQSNSSLSELSLKLLANINKKTIILENYKTKESAKDSVKDGHTFGALIIHKEFSSALLSRSMAQNFAASDDTIKNSTIKFYADTTDLMIFQAMYQTLIEAEFAFKKQMISEAIKGANTKAIDPIINFVDPPVYGSLDPKFRDFATPGFVLLVVYLFSMSSTALEIVGERVEGTLNRTLVAGVSLIEIILALITIQYIVLIIQTISLVVIIHIFEVKIEGNVFLMMCLMLIHGSHGMAFGLLMSSFSHDELMAMILCVGSFLPFLIISGVIWPLEGMHYILRTIALFTPQTLPILSLRNIMLKGWGIGQTLVWSGFVVSFGYLLFFILLATIFSSFLKD